MGYDLSNKLVVGLSSSALFDLTDSDNVFRSKGEQAYREYQREHQESPLATGVAFPFISRLLKLNKLQDEPLVEVILLSRNDPDTGLRVMNSIEHHGLPISRAVFQQGQSPYKLIPAFNIELFLSANENDIKQAVDAGYPAGHILQADIENDPNDCQLRIAFDFDGVIADDEAETVYKANDELSEFHSHEQEKKDVTHNPGPLKNFLQSISAIQKLELKKATKDASYTPVLSISIVTARSAPSHKRVINTMRDWDILVNNAFFMGGIDKSKVLDVIRPHIFFDDQISHLSSSSLLPSVHIPFGIANK